MSLRICLFSATLYTLFASSTALADENCHLEQLQGKALAKEQQAWPWLLYGAGGAVVLGVPGGLVTGLIGASLPPKSEAELSSASDCLLRGYKQKMRWRRFNRAVLGAIPMSMAIGMATSAVIASRSQS